MKRRLAAALVAILLCTACGDGGQSGTTLAPDQGQQGAGQQGDPRGKDQSGAQGGGGTGANLPPITDFKTSPSDQLPADLSKATETAPFLGENAVQPHQGMHIYWSNSTKTWPMQPGEPSAYPAIYAVADGVISHVDKLYSMGENDRYGIMLSFATEAGQEVMADYSIEPFTKEPSAGFYAKFITVEQGQQVKKGDVIAYMYVPPDSEQGTHLHFDLNLGGQLMQSPSIFTPEVVKLYAAKFDRRGGSENGKVLPACIGWKVSARQNPFGTGDVDCL